MAGVETQEERRPTLISAALARLMDYELMVSTHSHSTTAGYTRISELLRSNLSALSLTAEHPSSDWPHT